MKIMTIFQLYEYFVCIFIHKCFTHEIPETFCSYFKCNINVRTSINLRPGVYKKKSCEFSIKVTGPRIWNKLPIRVKSAKFIHTFKKYLRNYIFDTEIIL